LIEERERQLDVRMTVAELDNPTEKKNWPRCYPILRHKIFGDVPSGLKRTVAFMAYLGWFLFMVAVILNFGCAIATVVLSFIMKNSNWKFSPLDRIKMLILAAFFVIAGIPGHFIFTYWPLFQAMRTGNAARFLLHFIAYLVPIIVCHYSI
jgi:hypothetical protein